MNVYNKEHIYEDLLEAFIEYQYALEYPLSNATQHEKIMHYRTDNIFHTKVQSLVQGVMRIVDKHLDTE